MGYPAQLNKLNLVAHLTAVIETAINTLLRKCLIQSQAERWLSHS
jgi:hypothetical protein